MKLIAFAMTILAFSAQTFAAPTEIAACSKLELSRLQQTINEKLDDKFNYSKLMKNSKKETVGFYVWNSDENSMYAEVCENINSEFTVANEWYYWDEETSSSPTSWTTGSNYGISQDEGLAELKVLKENQDGNITFKFTIIGWEDEDQIKFRESILTLE